MKESFIELKLEEGDIYDYEMVNSKFNTDEQLNGKMQNKFPNNDKFSVFHKFLHLMLVCMM